MSEVWVLNLLHVDSVHIGKWSVHEVSHWVWNIEGADESCESWSQSGNGYDVLDVFILLQYLVNWIERVPPGSCLEEESSHGVLWIVWRSTWWLLAEELPWDGYVIASLWEYARCLRYQFPGKLFESDKQNNEHERSTEPLRISRWLRYEVVHEPQWSEW